MSFIGGNLHDIEASATRMSQTGAAAVASGSETHSAAVVLAASIDDAMRTMVTHFERIADGLATEIQQSHNTLVATDWHGQSRENAVAIKDELLGQVSTILATATGSLSAEKAAFVSRADALVESVQTDFQRTMNDVEARYGALAAASRRTADNLALADQTLTFG